MRAPSNLKISTIDDPATGQIVAFIMDGTYTGTYTGPPTIWMAGRPHPSLFAASAASAARNSPSHHMGQVAASLPRQRYCPQDRLLFVMFASSFKHFGNSETWRRSVPRRLPATALQGRNRTPIS
jgi:hypothetical protein